MRKFIDLLNEAVSVDKDAAPPTYEDGDEDHYRALRQTGFFGSQAAGAVLMAKTTGRIMLVLRSDQVEQPGTWGNCGGAHHTDERPVDAARREAHEETGYKGKVEMIPLLVFRKPGFKYENFLALVEDEFVPELGWEADDYVWTTLDKLPSPLHFGMVALFDDTASMAAIKHYAELFSDESISEDVDVSQVLAVAKKNQAAMANNQTQEQSDSEQPDEDAENKSMPAEKKNLAAKGTKGSS